MEPSKFTYQQLWYLVSGRHSDSDASVTPTTEDAEAAFSLWWRDTRGLKMSENAARVYWKATLANLRALFYKEFENEEKHVGG